MKSSGRYMSDVTIKERIQSFEYVRDPDNNPIGVVTLDYFGNIGWSLYNQTHEEEPAMKDKGLLIAWQRGLKGLEWIHEDLTNRFTEIKKAQNDVSRLSAVGKKIKKMAERYLKILEGAAS